MKYVIVGDITRDFIILPGGKSFIDIPGGGLLFAAGGLGIWDSAAGLVGRMDSAGSEVFNNTVKLKGFDLRGIVILEQSTDTRRFFSIDDIDTIHRDDPLSHFAEAGIPFPKSLLGYSPVDHGIDSRSQPTPFTIRITDFPDDYLDVTAAHICPLDFLSHALIPPALRQNHVNTITIDPGSGYMTQAFWDQIPVIFTGITALLTTEGKIRSLFQGRSSDLWEMAEAIAGMGGCDIIVIMRGMKGYLVYCHSSNTHKVIPAYPVTIINPLRTSDAFCGGFLAGYRDSYDPVQAALYGSISASFAYESVDPFYGLDAMPGLAQARLDMIKNMVRSA